jgi:hypothetical protein
MLSKITEEKLGEVEIHLHHDNDTAENLTTTLLKYKKILNEQHGFLCKDKNSGDIKYAFIHGNWCLDNSHPDGKWCGVNNEIEVLLRTGCYADFTMPAAPDRAQTTKINSIYYAVDDVLKPKSHNHGRDVEWNSKNGNGLLCVQGPLILNWKHRKMGIFPKIENGSIGWNDRINIDRIGLWLSANVGIKGISNTLFVKLYTHGCVDKNMNYLLDKGLIKLFELLENNFNDGINYKLYYASAREMVNIIAALENGEKGELNSFRDYKLILNK